MNTLPPYVYGHGGYYRYIRYFFGKKIQFASGQDPHEVWIAGEQAYAEEYTLIEDKLGKVINAVDRKKHE